MKWVLAALLSLTHFAAPAQQEGRFIPHDLRCDHKVRPEGITRARFGWKFRNAPDGFRQSAYQLQLAGSEEDLKKGRTFWDSGRIRDSLNFLIPYAGQPLHSARRYFWRVRIWDGQGKASPWSAASSFSTALLDEREWDRARWIAAEQLPDSLKVVPGVHGSGGHLGDKAVKRAVIPAFRKTFRVRKALESAFVFVSGLGHYELRLNGEKVGEDFLTPGWTDYADRCLYNAYELTSALRQGENSLGALVGTGFFYINRERYRKLVTAWGYPMLRLKLVLRYADGSVEEVLSDDSWKWAPSPIVYSSIYGGEDYDARLEQDGWDKPGFPESGWKPVVCVEGPGGAMKSQLEYPMRVMDTIDASDVRTLGEGKWLYDFGQNASGIIRLAARGRRGDTLRITPAELLDEVGLPTQRASGGPYYFSYVFKGEGTETWAPRFTYYGFRYALVEVRPGSAGRSGSPGTSGSSGSPGSAVQANALGQAAVPGAAVPGTPSLQLLHTRNSAPRVGHFLCSNPLFNKIFELIDWAIRSNLASVTTDCPHREKLGWLEQTHLVGGSIRYNYDILHLYNKIVDDMREAQLPDGLVPDIAPEYVPFEDGFRDSPEWGSASVIVPWYLYEWYGDIEVLKKAYPMMQAYLDYLASKADGHILSHGLGDWFDLGPNPPGPSQLTPIPLTATAIYYYDAVLMERIASLLGRMDDAALYRSLAAAIREAYNKRFFDARKGVYATGSQTAFAMSLYTGLVEEDRRAEVFRNLVDSIKANDLALTAGDIGYRYLVRTLEEGGAAQLLFDMNKRDDVPGYAYQLRQGATALTESWPALKYVSNNHMMLGHLMEWLYSGLAGIRQQEGGTAYRKIEIAPQPVEGVDWAEASYEAVSGLISSRWEKQAERFLLEVRIPPNTEAIVRLPCASEKDVLEGGKSLKQHKSIRSLGLKDGHLLLEVPSGDYSFECPM